MQNQATKAVVREVLDTRKNIIVKKFKNYTRVKYKEKHIDF